MLGLWDILSAVFHAQVVLHAVNWYNSLDMELLLMFLTERQPIAWILIFHPFIMKERFLCRYVWEAVMKIMTSGKVMTSER